jgi:hypothetical protein
VGRAIPAAIAVSLVLMLGVAWELRGLHAAVNTLVIRKDEIVTQTMTTEWTSSGLKQSVTTTRGASESAGDFADRHKEAVDALLAKYPKDT